MKLAHRHNTWYVIIQLHQLSAHVTHAYLGEKFTPQVQIHRLAWNKYF